MFLLFRNTNWPLSSGFFALGLLGINLPLASVTGDARMTDVMALTLMLFVQRWAFVNFRNTSVKGGLGRERKYWAQIFGTGIRSCKGSHFGLSQSIFNGASLHTAQRNLIGLNRPSEVWADATVPGTGATFFIAAGVLAPDTPSCGRGATLTGGEGGAKLLDVTLLPPANVPGRASRLQSCLQSIWWMFGALVSFRVPNTFDANDCREAICLVV